MKGPRNELARRTVGDKELKIGDWLSDRNAVARRGEVVGLLTWMDEQRRRNRWWRRLGRWLLAHSPFPTGPGLIVDRDPVRLLNLYLLRLEHEKRQRKAEKDGSKPELVTS